MNHFSNSEMIIQDDIDMTSLDESMEMMSESSVSLCNTNNNTSFSGLSHVDITSKYTEIYLSTILTGIKKVRIKKIIFQIKCPTCQDPEIILKRESKTNKFHLHLATQVLHRLLRGCGDWRVLLEGERQRCQDRVPPQGLPDLAVLD